MFYGNDDWIIERDMQMGYIHGIDLKDRLKR
jgi:hypothetical protein